MKTYGFGSLMIKSMGTVDLHTLDAYKQYSVKTYVHIESL